MEMRLKIVAIVILILLMSVTIGNADRVTLKNGQVIEGNVVEIFEEEVAILFDVVIEGELVGGKIKLYSTEVTIIEINEDYKHLKYKQLTSEEQEQEKQAYEERQKSNSDMDDRITSRIERTIKRRVEQKQREEDKVHEKEVITQRHLNRKDLITHSVDEHITPKVIIKDTNETTVTREEYYRDRE